MNTAEVTNPPEIKKTDVNRMDDHKSSLYFPSFWNPSSSFTDTILEAETWDFIWPVRC